MNLQDVVNAVYSFLSTYEIPFTLGDFHTTFTLWEGLIDSTVAIIVGRFAFRVLE